VDFFSPKAIVPKVAVKKTFEKFSVDKLEVKSGAVTFETSLADILPGLKLEFKGDDKFKGDLSATYERSDASFPVTLTGDIDLVNFSSVKASFAAGIAKGATLGGSGQLENKDGKFKVKDFSIGAGYSVEKSLFVGLKANKKISEFLANFHYKVNDDASLAGTVTYATPKTSLSLGGVYKVHPSTSVKVKFDNDGKLGLSATQKYDSKTSFTAAGIFDLYDIGAYKFGVTASLE